MIDKTINLECARSSESDELQLRWNWNPKIRCYAVVKMHTIPSYIDDDSLCEYINDDKNIDSRIKCYQLEYAKKSAFIYRLNDSDIGYLSFRVYPCSEDGNTILMNCVCNTVSVLGKIHEVNYSVIYDDIGKNYKSAIITIDTPVALSANSLSYNVSGISYTVKTALHAGKNTLNKIILAKTATVYLDSDANNGAFKFVAKNM